MFSKTLVFAFIGAFLIVGALGEIGELTDAAIMNCKTKDTEKERNACYHEAAGIQEDEVGCVNIDDFLQGTTTLSLQDSATVEGIKSCVKEAAGEKRGTCNRWKACITKLVQWYFNRKTTKSNKFIAT